MTVSYQQTDSTAVSFATLCSSVTNLATPSGRSLGLVGGTAGVTPQTVTWTTSSQFVGVNVQVQTDGTAPYATGTWTVRLNVTTANANMTWTKIDLCHIDANSNSLESLGSATISVSLSTTGVKSATVTGTAASVAWARGHAIMIVLSFTNGAMSTQSFAVTPDQLIDAPFTATAAFVQTATTPTTANFPWCAAQNVIAGTLRQASVGGTGSATTISLTQVALNTGPVFAWLLNPSTSTYWNSGTWLIPVNVTSANANFTPDVCYVCRVDANGGAMETLGVGSGAAAGLVSTFWTTTGVKTISVACKEATNPATGDLAAVVIGASNSASMSGSASITSNQNITAPLSTVQMDGRLPGTFPVTVAGPDPRAAHFILPLLVQ